MARQETRTSPPTDSAMRLAAQAIVVPFLEPFKEFPPRQSPDSWSPEAMMEKLKKNAEALKAAAHAG